MKPLDYIFLGSLLFAMIIVAYQSNKIRTLEKTLTEIKIKSEDIKKSYAKENTEITNYYSSLIDCARDTVMLKDHCPTIADRHGRLQTIPRR